MTSFMCYFSQDQDHTNRFGFLNDEVVFVFSLSRVDRKVEKQTDRQSFCHKKPLFPFGKCARNLSMREKKIENLKKFPIRTKIDLHFIFSSSVPKVVQLIINHRFVSLGMKNL